MKKTKHKRNKSYFRKRYKATKSKTRFNSKTIKKSTLLDKEVLLLRNAV